mgnify:CR=1 FL=1
MNAGIFRFLLTCAAVVAAAQVHAAPPVMRVKARLAGFDGTVMKLQTLGGRGIKAGEEFTAQVGAETRFVTTSPSSFAAIKAGDYVGAAVSEQRGGRLRAQEVFLYAEALRGSGEGRFPEGERLMVNGTITAVKPTAPEDTNDGIVTLHYRGAVLNNAGPNRTVCEGRATPAPFASALSCEADAVIEIQPGTRISALSLGDSNLLRPGIVVTVAITKPDGGKDPDANLALGVVVEPPPGNGTLEKPQSSP